MRSMHDAMRNCTVGCLGFLSYGTHMGAFGVTTGLFFIRQYVTDAGMRSTWLSEVYIIHP